MKNEWMTKDIDMSKEIWRPYIYKEKTATNVEVSNFGRVRTIGSLAIRKLAFGGSSHLSVVVSLFKGMDALGRLIMGKHKSVLVHRMVAETFKEYLKLPDGYTNINHKDLVIHHINGKSIDNQLTNLRVMTKTEHSRLHNQKRDMEYITDKTTTCSTPEDKVREICEYASKNKSNISDLVDRFGLTYNTIYGIIKGIHHVDITKDYDLSYYKEKERYEGMTEDIVRLIKNNVGRGNIISYLITKYGSPKKYTEGKVNTIRDRLLGSTYEINDTDQKEKYGEIHAEIERELLYEVRTNEAWSGLVEKVHKAYGLSIGVCRDLVKQRAAAICRRSTTVKIELPPENDPGHLSFCKFVESRKASNHVYKYEGVEPLVKKLLLDYTPLFDIKMMLMQEYGLTKNQASNLVTKMKRTMVQKKILDGSKFAPPVKHIVKKTETKMDAGLLNSFHMEIEEYLLDSKITTWQELLDYIKDLSTEKGMAKKQAYALVTYLLKRIIAPKPKCIISLYGRGPEVERLRQMYRAHENRKGGKFGEYYEIVDNLLRSGWSYIQIQPVLKKMNPDFTFGQMQGIVRNRKKAMESKKVA